MSPCTSPCLSPCPLPCTGRVPGWALQGALGVGGTLLRAPRGCGEQSLMVLAPAAAALRYLDESEGWAQLPPGHRQRGLSTLQQGEQGMGALGGYSALCRGCSAL